MLISAVGCRRERKILFLGFAELEHVTERVEITFVDETYTGGDYLALDDFVTCVAEELDVHRSRTVEEIFKRDVVDEVFSKVFISLRVGGIAAAYNDAYAVIEQIFGYLVAIVGGSRGVALHGGVILVDTEADVDKLDIRGKGVELRCQERLERVAAEPGVCLCARSGVDSIQEQVHRLVSSLLGRHG